MTNMQTAIRSIKDEINHLQSGMAYYVFRVGTLEKALAELNRLAGVSDSSTATASATKKKRASSKAAAPAKGKKLQAAKASRKEKAAGELPHTGGDYWPNLISKEPKHASEILQAAIEQMGFAPNQEQLQKLKQRMTFALNALVKANQIQDSGTGRARRFFKSAA